jgi:SAM-dependent methyltransferase
VADALFAEPRLAELYDPLDPDRSDLDAYAAMAREFGAVTVVDIGCGTGTFACLLASAGLDVTAVDPAAASLAVARRKPGALMAPAGAAGLGRAGAGAPGRGFTR